MKMMKQLMLVTAIATSGSAFAMQSMTDADLSATTGQDGITLKITPPALTGTTGGIQINQLILHDKDGFTGAAEGGAIVLGQINNTGTGLSIGSASGGSINVVIDASGGSNTAGATTGAAPVLNINVGLPSDLVINTGDISVAGSARSGIANSANNTSTRGITGTASKILSSIALNLGGATMNIQLGNTLQGGLIKMSGTLANGLRISGISLTDNTTGNGGVIGISNIVVTDHASTSLTVNSLIGVQNSGLVITSGSISTDIMMQGVTLGSPTSTLGDIEITGMNMAGTKVYISGH